MGFGREGFPIGVEEELLVVDAATLRLSNGAVALLERAGTPPEVDGRLVPDTYTALVELVSPVSESAAAAVAALDRLRARLRAAGGTLLGAGLHPDAAHGDVELFPAARYAEIHDEVRGLLLRTPTAALHVHVGMPDAETALRSFNGMRRWLPLLQALSANSPIWFGTDSGLASARAQVFRAFPSAEVPRAYASWDDYETATARVVAAAAVPDYTFLWQDVRLHPRLGTIEVRAMDTQAPSRAVAGLAALVRGLAIHECASDPATWPSREVVMASSFRAARDGTAATLWHEGSLRPVPDIAAAALRVAGDDPSLDEVRRIVRDGCGADRQRAAYARGGMDALLAFLRDETYA